MEELFVLDYAEVRDCESQLTNMLFPGGMGRDPAVAEYMRKEAASKAKQDLITFVSFGFFIEVVAFTGTYFGIKSLLT
ncbi:hypothetical protein QR680_012638 [Steinernema hermaphroditum]|uniref:Uncharacterized protein n=1 Tax=Steinernema hermaphroditum TaxID=289476 RepID=A0AA39I400_9BILA|nr:hypothetical protein QR680_012638 [Steinernema hermaphroditum]